MPPLNLPITVFGRPLKPVALGLTIICITLVWSNILDVGIFRESRWGDLAGAFAAVAAGLHVTAWVGRSQRLAEYALLATSAVMIYRSLGLLFLQGPLQQSVWLSIGVGVIAAGSYVLERLDPRPRGGPHAA